MTYLQQTIIQASALIGGFVLLMLTVYLILRSAIKKDERKKLNTNQLDGGSISVVEQYKKLTIDIWNLMQKGLADSDIEIQSLEKQRQNIIDYIRQLGENRKSKINWGNLKEVFLCGLLIVMSVLFICFLYKIWCEVRFIYIFMLIILFFGSLVQCVSRMEGGGLNIDIDDIDNSVLTKLQSECDEIYYEAIDKKWQYEKYLGDGVALNESELLKYNLTLWIINNIHTLHLQINKIKQENKSDINYSVEYVNIDGNTGRPYGIIMIIASVVMIAALLFILYQIWYYVCCGFLCFEFESLGDKIMAFVVSMIGLGFIGGFIAICFGWNPPD